MSEIDKIEVVAEVCFKAHETVANHGTPEMQATMGVLLFQICQEIARRETERQQKHEGG